MFNIKGEYRLNVFNGDTLKELDTMKEWGVDKFDVIVGNPPYQQTKASGDNKLYLDFTKLSISLLKTGGLLLFITPRNVLEYLLLVEKNRKYIDIFYQLKYIAIETSNKYFPSIGSTFVFFLLEKLIYYTRTIIEFMYCNNIETVELFLEKGFKIPRVLTKLDMEIITLVTSKTNNYVLSDFIFDNKTQRIRTQHINKNIVSVKETQKHKIKIIDTINKTNTFPGKFYYYDKKDSVFDYDKLILSKKGYLMPYIDRTKSYTYSDNFKYIIDDNLDQIKLLFDSIIVKYLLFQYSKNGFDSMDIIKTISRKKLHNINDEDGLYKLYNLTDKHYEHINNILGLRVEVVDEDLTIKNLKQLKEMAKGLKIKGYSGLKKDILISKIKFHSNTSQTIEEEVDEIVVENYSEFTMKRLKEIAKKLKIKRYSIFKSPDKQKLISLIKDRLT